jgi:hypothetical protein
MALETLKTIGLVLGCCVNEWCPLKWERPKEPKSRDFSFCSPYAPPSYFLTFIKTAKPASLLVGTTGFEPVTL